MHVLSESALAAGRTLGLRRILEHHPEALDAFVPGLLKSILGKAGRSIAAAGVRRTLRKYADVQPDDLEGTLRELLDTLAELLESGTAHADAPTTALSAFTFADITLAEGLAFIVPPKSHLKLSEASRLGYTWADRPKGYDAVFAWRDALYAARG